MSTIDNIQKEDYSSKFLETLKNSVKPALGCTEPVAVGLATAVAFKEVRGRIEKIEVEASNNIYKNGMGVYIPGTKKVGLAYASALGATCGDSSLGLEVFRPVNDLAVAESEKLIKDGKVKVGVENKKGNFYIMAKVETEAGSSICIIKDYHTNIVYLETNGKIILNRDEDKEENTNINEYLKDISLQDVREFVESVPYSDIEYLLEGVRLNMDIAKVGLKEKSGPGLGAALDQLMSEGMMQKDIINKARILTAAACDARMAGVNMPVMSSAGSGNHGITAIIPPTIICEHMNYDEEKLARTLAFSHLVTAYIKVFTGGLSPVCGCAVAAGIGASASIAWALGGTNKQVAGSIRNMVGNLTGMVCDGAKGGCAFKLSTASAEAIIQAKLAMLNVIISDIDGIVSPGAELTIKNLGSFCSEGMKSADEEIIDIMLKH